MPAVACVHRVLGLTGTTGNAKCAVWMGLRPATVGRGAVVLARHRPVRRSPLLSGVGMGCWTLRWCVWRHAAESRSSCHRPGSCPERLHANGCPYRCCCARQRCSCGASSRCYRQKFVDSTSDLLFIRIPLLDLSPQALRCIFSRICLVVRYLPSYSCNQGYDLIAQSSKVFVRRDAELRDTTCLDLSGTRIYSSHVSRANLCFVSVAHFNLCPSHFR